jgi:hypothetical protein
MAAGGIRRLPQQRTDPQQQPGSTAHHAQRNADLSRQMSRQAKPPRRADQRRTQQQQRRAAQQCGELKNGCVRDGNGALRVGIGGVAAPRLQQRCQRIGNPDEAAEHRCGRRPTLRQWVDPVHRAAPL